MTVKELWQWKSAEKHQETDMKIIDGHTHVASSRYVSMEFFEGIVDNMVEQAHLSPVPLSRARLMDSLLTIYQDHDASIQVREMDKLGVEKAVLLLPDFTFALKRNELTIEEMYLEHRTILERYPGRFEVFAGVDPRWGKDGFDLFVKGIEQYGFRGLKLYPPCGYRPDDDILTPYYEYCEENHLPVLFHIGPTSPALSFNEAMPFHVDAPARKYGNVSFILAHGAVNYQEQCVNLCKYRPNVYLDISGAQTFVGESSPTNGLIKLYRSQINHKIIFGSDWPLNNRLNTNRAFISMLSSEGDFKPYISIRESQAILSGNMERILSKARFVRQYA